MHFANDISVISSTDISLIFICYRVTPGLSRPTSVTRRIDTGALPPMPGTEPWLSGRTGTHRSASGATPGMRRRKSYRQRPRLPETGSGP